MSRGPFDAGWDSRPGVAPAAFPQLGAGAGRVPPRLQHPRSASARAGGPAAHQAPLGANGA
eukprot:1182812-Lingulodinium_polyedra.AAC.1